MKKTIWKFQISNTGVFKIGMPKNSKILCVQTQFDDTFIWAIVTPENEIEQREFLVVGTGHILPETQKNKEYIGTFQQLDGSLVWHLFELVF